ncbi:hypothetical protein E4U15_004378 [Claviceps sp. LM218 group G6]|nr:hypothetical protein E4U15_004378 [Claviceps sp. LM218 group G6]
MGSVGRMPNFSGEDTAVYRYRDGGATEFGERRGNPDFSQIQCSDYFYPPYYSTGPANRTFCSLPPCSSILEGPCPPAPIPRAVNLTDTGTSPSHFFSLQSDPSPPAPIPRAVNLTDTGTSPSHFFSLQSDTSPPATIPWGTDWSDTGASGSSVGAAYQNPPRGTRKFFVTVDEKKASTEAQLRRNLVAKSSAVYRLKEKNKRKLIEMEEKYKDTKSKNRELEEKLRQEREASQRKDEALRRKDEEIERLKRGK